MYIAGSGSQDNGPGSYYSFVFASAEPEVMEDDGESESVENPTKKSDE